MTWDAYHRRKSALREVLAVADRHRDDVDAATLLDLVPQAREAFETPDDLLRELQMAWFQQLSGALDRAGAEGPVVEPEVATLDAWESAALTAPSVRRVLDRAGDDAPALAVGLDNERRLLAASAGRRGASALEDGERLRAAARDRTELPAPGDDDEARGLIARLRQALAA